ncbi:MAG TPA: ATP-binding protein [Paludibacteraceae bacterium]|jgi:predicted AAA+ superfamily ATPase|nr:ATP-binding protein [Paludibacteraceae bacterium]
MIKREVEAAILKRMDKEKIILLFGARQVGKTTLLKQLTQSGQYKTTWLNADDAVVQALFDNFSEASFTAYIGNPEIVVIDEAQQIMNIGKCLKILYDSGLTFQLIASGSSAFELRNKTSEPLTGRKWEYHLYPFSFKEMAEETNPITEVQQLPLRLLFGMYPEILLHKGEERDRLQWLMDSYLYKDVIMWQGLKKPEKIIQLLKALAMQTGSEVSYNELSGLIKLDRETVEKYINILEEAYIIFRLPSYSTNKRKELSKSRKIYFFDNGIRNSLLGDFRPIEARQDTGALWENYIISELWKSNQYRMQYSSFYFWRTSDQQEIDLIIEKDGLINAYEIKWNPVKKARLNKTFINYYPHHTFNVINRDNYAMFLL